MSSPMLYYNFQLQADRLRICVLAMRRRLSRRHRHVRSPRAAWAPLRVHIGHCFWGAGNAGDDFMLAGFLREIRRLARPVHFTCSVPENHAGLRLRYPEIQWLEYTISARWNAMASAECWLGLGGTPFQCDSGPFFERHLEQEWAICQAIGLPMDFLGIGVEHAAVMNRPGFRRLFQSVRHSWARDELSASWLNSVVTGRTTAAADLANILFAELHPDYAVKPPSRGIGYLLNFEKLTESLPDLLPALLEALPGEELFWLVQDRRLLPGMERYWWVRLPDSVRSRFLVVELGQECATTVPTEMPGTVISSRYHGALLAAWSGSRVMIIARSGKMMGLAQQLGVQAVDSVHDVRGIVSGVAANAPVPRERLRVLAEMAATSVTEWFALACS